jgi:hypothetical protein
MNHSEDEIIETGLGVDGRVLIFDSMVLKV